MPSSEKCKNNRIKIESWGGIGDVLLTTPAIRTIKEHSPECKVIVYCRSQSHYDTLYLNPFIDELRPAAPLLSRLGKQIVEPISASVLRPDAWKLRPSITYREHLSIIIGSMLGVSVTDTSPILVLSEAERSRARTAISGFRGAIVAMCIGAHCTISKHWYFERWSKLVAGVPATFVQIGAAGEPHIPGAQNFLGMPLRDSFALLSTCDAYVGLDSALMHAAAALRIPSVILYGPTASECWMHPGQIAVFERKICSPCIDWIYSDACPFERECMQALSVERVQVALERVLSTSRS